MFCPNCGNQVNKDAKFCGKCGSTIGEKDVSVNTSKYSNNVIKKSNKKKSNKKIPIVIGMIVIIVAIIIVLICMLGGNDNGEDKKSENGKNSGSSNSSGNPFENGLAVGDTVYFGKYEQDNDSGNGEESILWDVIAQSDKGFLLLSHYVLDNKPYEEENKGVVDFATGDSSSGVTWERSSIREWLNNDFMDAAFNTNEQSYIVPVTNSTSDFKETLGQETHYQSLKGGIGGNDTEDSVFLLSIEDYCRYLNPAYVQYLSYIYISIDALAGPTKYARVQGATIEEFDNSYFIENGCTGEFDEDYNGIYAYWMLRNSGSAQDQITVMNIADFGNVAASHHTSNPGGIRPAIWVNAPANGDSVTDEEMFDDPYSKCIGNWGKKEVYSSMEILAMWLDEPLALEITEHKVIAHSSDYSADREDLKHSNKNGIDYFTADNFRFYYKTDEDIIVFEIKMKDGSWYRWVDFE